MWTAASVLGCLVTLLGNPADLPRIELVERAPPHATPGVQAFVGDGDRRIYLLVSTPLFQRVLRGPQRCADLAALSELAAIVRHEEWHLRHGPDEGGAYRAQLLTLAKLGISPDSRVYLNVQRAMIQVVAARNARLDRSHAGVMASRTD